MKCSSRFVVATVVVAGCLLVSAGPTNASTDSSTTSSTVPSSDSSSASTSTTTTTVVPASTAAEISALYPTRALRFPPYTRLNPPEVPKNSGFGRRVIYKNNLQWVWIIDAKNEVVRAMPVSGRRGVPTPGEYKVNSQSLRSYSLDFEGVWFNNMTRFALGPEGGNIGFHAIPTKNGKVLQTEDQLGSFQGSGCLRLRPDDAKFIFNFAKPGTKVVVLP
ncbi:MAG: L,D-transpeptidase [Actinobacteria bacterium]|nr:L,D-transpeptidase [Actinomycetota bacterium]